MPVTSTLLDQAHNAIDRKLFMMKAFHHPRGSQRAFLTGLAHLYNLVPYQRRAQHAGQCEKFLEARCKKSPSARLTFVNGAEVIPGHEARTAAPHALLIASGRVSP